MLYSRADIITAARNCLRDRKHCPVTCPLLQSENCQKIILREAIKMYDEIMGRFSDEDEQVFEEENAQEEA